ncbi:MAG: hypothetical protein ACLTTQ_03320 [Christensenellales bacterium]
MCLQNDQVVGMTSARLSLDRLYKARSFGELRLSIPPADSRYIHSAIALAAFKKLYDRKPHIKLTEIIAGIVPQLLRYGPVCFRAENAARAYTAGEKCT